MSNICKCHGHLTNVQEAAALARKTKRNVPVCLARPAASAFDAHTEVEVKNKIARAKRNAALDADADREIALLFPALESAVEDNAEEEAEAFGLNGEDSHDNEVDGTGYVELLNAERQRWNAVAARNRVVSQAVARTGRYAPASNNTAKAADAVAVNAKRARGYSMFQSAASIMKRQRKSA